MQHKVGLLRRKPCGEVSRLFGLHLSAVKIRFDVMPEDVPRPAVLNGLLDVPLAGGRVFDFGDDDLMVPPRDLSNKLLDQGKRI